jgi:hypothetical protein
MEVSATNISYREWRDAVDQRLHQVYCITLEDAGMDDEYLTHHWRSNKAPSDFVEWFGDKHDLTSAWEVGLKNAR